ncbi:MAG: hypothetical protein A4E62_02022 [Syntrophorhabdus sp. PtaU1.Bin002]|nr:MAG: hypothetical protein A4E62_02022 [Syntrophorhabdus sp. PtaU1.Bin002]
MSAHGPVADDSNAEISLHFLVFIIELGFELGFAYVMDTTEKTVSEDGHTSIYGSHMGMVISPIEKMTRTVLL